MPRKLERMTLREQAEKALREMILSHRFAPGKWINVEQIARDLGVSRTPVWDALKNLEEEKLVEHVPNKGIRMAHMTLEMARDLYLVRGLLEGLAGRLAAGNIDRRTIASLESILKKQLRLVKDLDVVEYSTSDFKFHGLVYDACGNWLLQELLQNIKARSRPFICDIKPILPDLYRDHLHLLNSLKAHEPDQAEECMRRHNERMKNQIEASATK